MRASPYVLEEIYAKVRDILSDYREYKLLEIAERIVELGEKYPDDMEMQEVRNKAKSLLDASVGLEDKRRILESIRDMLKLMIEYRKTEFMATGSELPFKDYRRKGGETPRR